MLIKAINYSLINYSRIRNLFFVMFENKSTPSVSKISKLVKIFNSAASVPVKKEQ